MFTKYFVLSSRKEMGSVLTKLHVPGTVWDNISTEG